MFWLKIILLPLLLPLAAAYALVIFVRNLLYDCKILKTYSLKNVNVLSVGNITAGGTGKTPVTAFLTEEFLKRNLNIGIISRGYGGQYAQSFPIAHVTPNENAAAEKFGDEPTWYAQRFPEIQVYVGADKVATAAELIKYNKVDMIIADDAFQHRRLGRNLDLVLLDASVSLFDYLPLPLGRGREDFYFALRRADILILNKINFVDAKKLAQLKKIIQTLKPARVPLIEMKTEITGFTDLQTQEKFSFKDLQNQTFILACAIARPEQFLKLVKDGGLKVAAQLFLPDHAPFTANVSDQLDQLLEKHAAKYILVTEKDAVKLKGMKLKSRVLVSELKISSKELVDAISARLNR